MNFTDLCSATKVFSANFWGCGTFWKIMYSPWWHATRSRNFWRMHTQGAIFPSIDWHVFAQVLSDKLNATKVGWSGPFNGCSFVAVNRQAWGEDTRTPTGSKHSPKLEGTDRKTDHGVQCDSVSSPLPLPGLIAESWMKLLWHVSACYCTWWVWLLCTHAHYVNSHTGHTHADCSTKVFFTKSPFFAN